MTDKNEEVYECARIDCSTTYIKKTHNQKYCTDECCRLATNQRIMVGYYKTRDRKRGVERWCQVCDATKLSRYNSSDVCSACKARRISDANSAAVDMLRNSTLVS